MSTRTPIEELIGRRSGMLEVIGEAAPYTAPSGKRTRRLVVRCDCGVEKELHKSMVIGGRHNRHLTKSCGCAQYKRGRSALLYEGKTLEEWADHSSIPLNTISERIKRGWTLEAAVTTPLNQKLSRRVYD